MNYVTYQQAAKLLGIDKVSTIRTAANKKRLTKVPTTSMDGCLIKEQVMLFKGKKQIRYAMLSDEEKYIWDECEKNAKNLQKAQEAQKKYNITGSIIEKIFGKIEFPQEIIPILEKASPEQLKGIAYLAKCLYEAESEVPKGVPFPMKA